MDSDIRKLHLWARVMTYVTGSLIAMIMLIVLVSRISSAFAFFAAGLSVILIYFLIALTIPMNMEKPTIKERASYAVHQLGGKNTYSIASCIVAAVFFFMGTMILLAGPKSDKDSSSKTARSSATITTEATIESTTSTTTTSTTTAATTTVAHSSSNGHNPELVAFLDAYEAFVDEYCEFMRSYLANPLDYNLIAQYTQILQTLDEYTSAANNYDTSDLSAADVEYYLEVIARCTAKMFSVYY